MHQPRNSGLAASPGVRQRANETEISAALWAHEARERLYSLSLSLSLSGTPKAMSYYMDSIALRSPFYSRSTAIRPRYDHSTTYVTTVGLPVSGLLHSGLST